MIELKEVALVIFWGESCWYAYTGVELAELGTSSFENVRASAPCSGRTHGLENRRYTRYTLRLVYILFLFYWKTPLIK